MFRKNGVWLIFPARFPYNTRSQYWTWYTTIAISKLHMTFSKMWLGLSHPWCPRNAPDWINQSVIGLLTQRWSLARSNWSHSKSSSFDICTNCPEQLSDPLQSFSHMSFPVIWASQVFSLIYSYCKRFSHWSRAACSRITRLVWCSSPCQKISEHFSEPFCNWSGAFWQRKSKACFIALIVGN